jgi:hypothetical protein
MDDEMMARMTTIGSELERRSLELELSNQDAALMMQSLAVTLEGIRYINQTLARVDGLEGLGRQGNT